MCVWSVCGHTSHQDTTRYGGTHYIALPPRRVRHRQVFRRLLRRLLVDASCAQRFSFVLFLLFVPWYVHLSWQLTFVALVLVSFVDFG